MGRHRSPHELRERFVQAVAQAKPSDPLQFLTMDDVARKADIRSSTLAYQVDGVGGLREHAYAAVVAELEAKPSALVMRSLEAELRRAASVDEIVASFFWAATRQVSEDPSFSYWVGGKTLDENSPEIVAACHRVSEQLGIRFARPLRLALSSAGLDLSSVPDKAFVDLTATCLVAGSLARYLEPDAQAWELRGVRFCAGGVAMAAALQRLAVPVEQTPVEPTPVEPTPVETTSVTI